ncbi:hypothetical protein SAMD00023353_1800790 [Rosellinia necatrix]|uniref:Uncharacterized protein n=1 Tax=Rosellinia necatrix TaxID=77044 RepID=A0A1W2TE86_ROSNE|nr:hypothetical protein SAMD00023353_1800790 [Rosellinia necatrix]
MSYYWYYGAPVAYYAPANPYATGAGHPLESYFPQEMHDELKQLNGDAEAEQTAAPNTAASAGGAQGDAANEDATSTASTAKTASAPAPAPAPAPEITNACFEVVHSVRYTPPSPFPGDERTESHSLGKFGTAREANERAMKEVYDKYGGLAHAGKPSWMPPNSDWLHRAGGREDWPDTWKLVDGRLGFSVICSKLDWTLKGDVYIVQW